MAAPTDSTSSYENRAKAIDQEIAEAERDVRAALEHVAERREDIASARRRRWALIADMRQTNMTWRQVGDVLGISESRAAALGRKHAIS